MKDKINNIDDLLRDKVYDYSAPPPESMWNNIEQSLGNNKRKKLVFFYFKIAAGFIFLTGLTALFVSIINRQNPDDSKPVVAEKTMIFEGKKYSNSTNLLSQTETKLISAKKKISKKSESKNHTNNILNESGSVSENITVLNENISSPVIAQIADEAILCKISGIEPSISQKSDSKIILNNAPPGNTNIVQNPNNALFDDLLAANEREKTRNLAWSVGGQAGPQYTYRKLTNETQVGTNTTDYDNYDAPMLAYAGGLQIEIEPTKRLSVQSGIYYSKVGQKISSRYVDANKNDYFAETETHEGNRPVEIVNSIGVFNFSDDAEKAEANVVEGQDNMIFSPATTNNEKANYTGEQYFEFIEIPLILKYKIIDQKLGVKIIGGLNSDILVNNNAKVTNSSNVTLETTTSDVKTFNYSGTLGFGFEYPLSKNMLFSLEPFFKYYLSPINKSTVNDAHPYMIGIMTGVNYSF